MVWGFFPTLSLLRVSAFVNVWSCSTIFSVFFFFSFYDQISEVADFVSEFLSQPEKYLEYSANTHPDGGNDKARRRSADCGSS